MTARQYAADANAGHPMAYQSSLHIALVTPNIVVAIAAICLGCLGQWNRKSPQKIVLLGIILGGVAIFLTLTDILGATAAQHWIEPHPGVL